MAVVEELIKGNYSLVIGQLISEQQEVKQTDH